MFSGQSPTPGMVWGRNWTPERVAERLVAVFRALPNTPIYSPRKGVFEPSRPIDGLELVTAVQLCLGRESPAAQRLLVWARMRGTGQSVRAHYRENGRPRSTAYYRRRRSLKRIAAFLNEQRDGKVTALAPAANTSAGVGEEAKQMIRVLPSRRVLIDGDLSVVTVEV
jgi:hypothetical protein